ncbi:MAG: hypothetical protein QOJ66_3633 [Ilumatobacteraceae bacterium]
MAGGTVGIVNENVLSDARRASVGSYRAGSERALQLMAGPRARHPKREHPPPGGAKHTS